MKNSTIKIISTIIFALSISNFAAGQQLKFELKDKKLIQSDKTIDLTKVAKNDGEKLVIIVHSDVDLTGSSLTWTYKDSAGADQQSMYAETVTSSIHDANYKIEAKYFNGTFKEFTFSILDSNKVPISNPQIIKLNSQGNTTKQSEPDNTKNLNQPTGSIYYDAFILTNSKKINKQLALNILGYYSKEELSENKDLLMKVFNDNALLKAYVVNNWSEIPDYKDSNGKVIALQNGEDTKSQLSSFSLSSLGGIDVTTIADGFAKFIVKRTKEELNITFFTQFTDKLKENKDLHILFPQTTRALLAIGDNIYNYSAYIQTLRECYKKDITALPDHLPDIIDLYDPFFDLHPDLKYGFNSSIFVAKSLRDKEHPGSILADFPLNDLDNPKITWGKPFMGCVQTLQLFSESLKDTARAKDAKYWINAKQLHELTANEEALKLYFGLLQLRASKAPYNGIAFNDNQNYTLVKHLQDFTSDWNKHKQELAAYKEYMSNLILKFNELNSLIKNYQNPANDSIAVEEYANYYNASLNLFKSAAKARNLPGIKALVPDDVNKKIDDYFSIATSVYDLVQDVNQRKYSAAIMDAANIYQIIVVIPAENDACGNNNDKTDSLAVKSKAAFTGLIKYGTFMANVASAKTSDEVEAAIETVVLPQGSSRIKRESAFNVSLNAYCGLFLGKEHINGIGESGGLTNFPNSWGVTAPIGLAASWGWPKHHSFSLFASIVDLGAIAAFRFSNDTIASIPTVKLKDIVSPGLFISWGIPKTPISLNVGWQSGPILRKVEAQANEYKNSYGRVSLSVLVDLPLFNLYTKSKK